MRSHLRFRGLAPAVIVIGILLLAACSTPTSPTDSGTSAKDTKPNGSLVTAVMFSGQGSIDPQLASFAMFRNIGVSIFDTLIGLTSDLKERPDLAERWEIAPDGMTHTFYIRKGVKFHDGSPLTGEDVKFSLERIMAPEATNPDAAAWRGQIDRVELKDDYTVVLHLKQPQFELLKGFADFSGTSAVVPKKYIQEKGAENFTKNPMGSGPWKVVKSEVGVRMELEAVEDHWREVPKFKNITILNLKEEGTKLAMLKTGELDLAEIAPDSVQTMKAAGLRVIRNDTGETSAIWYWYDLEHPEAYAFSDIRVRKALSYAVNRQEIADNLLMGFGIPGVLRYAPRTSYFFDANLLKPDPYDPEQAKRLLSQAGYPNGFSTKIWDSRGGFESQITQAVAGYWRKVGVNAELTPIESTAMGKLYAPKLSPTLWNTVWILAGTGAISFEKMVTSYHSTKGVPKNHTNKKLDELIDKVPLTRDPAEKKKLATEAAVLAKEEHAVVAIVDIQQALAVNSKIGDMELFQGLAMSAAVWPTISHSK